MHEGGYGVSSPQRTRFGCEVDGCEAHPSKGDTIIRTSPKGELFRGRCEAHYEGVPDMAVTRIADA